MIVWKPLKDYEGLYEVNNEGSVRSVKTLREKVPWTHPNGYSFVWLYKNKKKYNVRVYRAVAEAFIPNTEHKPFIDHINRIRTDNRVENLRWVTKEENMCNPLTRLFRAKYICEGRLATEVAKEKGITMWTFRKRIKEGKTIEECCGVKGGDEV